nr:N-6 DNA methylase [uncultured Acetatifactor sp.]
MKKLLLSIQAKFPECSICSIERAFIHSYIRKKSIEYRKSDIICSFLNNDSSYEPIADYVDANIEIKEIDDLIVMFEILVDTNEKKNKGVVYTPPVIRDYISQEVIGDETIPVLIDPSCGCGAFLISSARSIKEKHEVTYNDLFTKYIYGADIDAHSIEKCKVLLSLLALETDGEIVDDYPNLFVCNSLDCLDKKKYKHKFDAVIGNPPYVRAKNIDTTVKASLSKWSVVTGNVDLYIPFYQLGMELLKTNGILGYISPNTFLQSINGRGLRNYIRDEKVSVRIINFKGVQKFQGITSYTCVVLLRMDGKCNMKYALNSDGCLKECQYTNYDISTYMDNQEWRFGNSDVDKLIYKIEHQPQKLDDYGIRNGLATLCNDLFFFTSYKEDARYFYRTYNNKRYKIEKQVCIDVAKPNIMRSEIDLVRKGEKAIFPYENGAVIPEVKMQTEYPCTYGFLKEYKDRLNSRDKGKTDNYPAWYAYGRTQGMNNKGLKVLVPYMADRGVAIMSENENLLFYCGYAVFAKDERTLLLLKHFIESDVFWFYIRMTSKPYSKGFMALAKNYIKNFGIPNLSDAEEEAILSLPAKEREEFIADLYKLDYKDVKRYIEMAS